MSVKREDNCGIAANALYARTVDDMESPLANMRRQQMNWGLREKVVAIVGFIVGVAALVTAVQTIATHSKPWICSVGAPISWCRPPNPPETWSSEWGGTKGGVPSGMRLEFGGAISGNMRLSFQAARSIG